MQPSSLVFVVLIGIWVAYVTLYTVRRREQMAMARTVDRFSMHMRVLQRRAVNSTGHQVRHASTGPLTRALVTAGHAESPAQGESLVQTAAGAAGSHATAHDVAPHEETAALVASRSAVRVNRSFAAVGKLTQAARVVGTATASVRSRRSSRPALPTGAGARLAAFGASIAATLVLVFTSLFHVTAWWSVMFGGLCVLAVLASGRASVHSGEARRTRTDRARREAAVRRARAEAAARLEARPLATDMPVAQDHVAPELRTQREIVLPEAPAAVRRDEPFDLMADLPGWEPTPVPRPTYTLKARADHPLPEPLDVPVPIEVEDDFDEWAGQERGRRVSGA